MWNATFIYLPNKYLFSVYYVLDKYTYLFLELVFQAISLFVYFWVNTTEFYYKFIVRLASERANLLSFFFLLIILIFLIFIFQYGFQN